MIKLSKLNFGVSFVEVEDVYSIMSSSVVRDSQNPLFTPTLIYRTSAYITYSEVQIHRGFAKCHIKMCTYKGQITQKGKGTRNKEKTDIAVIRHLRLDTDVKDGTQSELNEAGGQKIRIYSPTYQICVRGKRSKGEVLARVCTIY